MPTAHPGAPVLSPLGDAGLLLTFGDTLAASVNQAVHRYADRVRRSGLPGLLEVVPAYTALAVHFDPGLWDWRRLGAALADLPEAPEDAGAARVVTLPVCYGGAFGPDLEVVASHCALSPDEVVARHCGATYRVFLLGFTPGFPYLGGLDPALATPRRATPRTLVPRGAVGIAGLQTGVYPLESPGGWQLIGRTPLALFDPLRPEPCLLRPGDTLRFEAIGAPRFQELALSWEPAAQVRP